MAGSACAVGDGDGDGELCGASGCVESSGEIYGATTANIAVAEFYSSEEFGFGILLTANGTSCDWDAESGPGAIIHLMLPCASSGSYDVASDLPELGCTASGFTEVDGSDWAWATSGTVVLDSVGEVVTGSFELDFSNGWLGDGLPAADAGFVSGSFRATRCVP